MLSQAQRTGRRRAETSVRTYDPDTAPEPTAWLALDEQLRMIVVEQYHQRRRIRMPNIRLHAVMHTAVENELSEGEAIVTETLLRLRNEGLSRHEAIHAIASVLITHMHGILTRQTTEPFDTRAYYNDLQRLTKDSWRTAFQA
jgi:hypothetical protein